MVGRRGRKASRSRRMKYLKKRQSASATYLGEREPRRILVGSEALRGLHEDLPVLLEEGAEVLGGGGGNAADRVANDDLGESDAAGRRSSGGKGRPCGRWRWPPATGGRSASAAAGS